MLAPGLLSEGVVSCDATADGDEAEGTASDGDEADRAAADGDESDGASTDREDSDCAAAKGDGTDGQASQRDETDAESREPGGVSCQVNDREISQIPAGYCRTRQCHDHGDEEHQEDRHGEEHDARGQDLAKEGWVEAGIVGTEDGFEAFSQSLIVAFEQVELEPEFIEFRLFGFCVGHLVDDTVVGRRRKPLIFGGMLGIFGVGVGMPYNALMAGSLAIGNLVLRTNVLLAPLSGYTDVSFRLVARSCGGVGLAYTDLLCPEGVVRENRRSMELAATCEEDSPLALQLYGSDPVLLAEAARWAEDHGADVVDLNMGCPAEKVTRRDGGSRLLCDPGRALRIVECIKGALRRVPLTVKMRLGWDERSIVAPYLAPRLENAGAAMIVVHGRTTEMQYSGYCRLEDVGEVVASVKAIPVVGNGDIRSAGDAKRMMDGTGCAGVMVGRYALSSPWIFRDIWSFMTTGVVPPEPTLEEKCRLMRDHFRNLVHYRGVRIAVMEFRRRATWYGKRMNPCRMLREEMRFINTPEDFERAIERFLEWRTKRGVVKRPAEIVEEGGG